MKVFNIEELARENIKNLHPYASARDDFGGSASVFLDANENPNASEYNRYPDPHQRVLKDDIAKLKNVRAEQIFLGNGSDEAIDLLIRVFCVPSRDNVLIPEPTYGMYSICAAGHDVKIISSKLTPSFDLDSSVILSSATPRSKIIFLCSPNNPSGNLLNTREIEVVLNNFPGIVVIDEAYVDFSGSPSWLTKLADYQNLVVLQTFSKAWGLAGLRLGMCFSNRTTIELLDKIKLPYNINSFTQTEVIKSINNGLTQKEKWVAELISERNRVKERLAGLQSVRKIYPSNSNFLLVEISNARTAYDQLVRKGIIVRDRSHAIRCENCLRITVGTPSENNQLIQAMESL